MAYQEIIFSPPDLMQDALTKVNENFNEVYGNHSLGWEIKTASFTVDANVHVYEVDCTAGNITATFDLALYTYTNKIFHFKRIDSSANLFYIDEGSGLTLIDGNIFPFNTGMVQWDNLMIGFNGTNFRVL